MSTETITLEVNSEVAQALKNVSPAEQEKLQVLLGIYVSRFIESLVKPHVLYQELDAAYHQMAQDEAREAEAFEWAEATIGDVSDGAR